MDFDKFHTEAQALGRRLKRSSAPDELGYLSSLAKMVDELKSIPRVKMENQELGWQWTLLGYKSPVGSVRMKLRKFGKLPLHDHRGYISLLYVVSGEVKITHYSSDNISPKRKSFELREISTTCVKKGEFSFSTTASNLHSVEDLGSGSVLLDISTFLKGRGDSFGINIEPITTNRKSSNLYTGSWSGIKF